MSGWPDRGYSRMQHFWFLERVVDIARTQLDFPADEMRLRNYIRPKEFLTRPNGCVYDSGNYPKMLQVAKGQIWLENWKKRQARRSEGRAAAGDRDRPARTARPKCPWHL